MAEQTRTRARAVAKGPVETARSALRLVEIGLDLILAAVLLVVVAIGLVAVVRRILIATAQVEQLLAAGKDIAPILFELGALAGLVLTLAIALSLARRHSGRASEYEAD